MTNTTTTSAKMSKNVFLATLNARRDSLATQHLALIAAGDFFAAEDLWPKLQFAIRAAYDALVCWESL